MKNDKTLLIGICILFVFIFIILVGKQQDNKLADITDSPFNMTTIEGSQLVARDLDAIYPKYYVVFFDNTDNTYIIHCFNYYETSSQYDLEFNRLLSSIVDYDYEKNMIRYIVSKGYGDFYTVRDDLPFLTNSLNLKIYD